MSKIVSTIPSLASSPWILIPPTEDLVNDMSKPREERTNEICSNLSSASSDLMMAAADHSWISCQLDELMLKFPLSINIYLNDNTEQKLNERFK